MKKKAISDFRTLFESEKEDYYKPVRIGNAFSISYIKCESNGDKTKTLSIKEYLEEIKPYLKDIISNLKKSDIWKIQLRIAINSMSSKDTDK